MSFLKTGWLQASGKQRVAVVTALVIGMGGAVSLGNAGSPGPTPTDTARAGLLAVPAPAPPSTFTPESTSPTEPTAQPTQTAQPTSDPTAEPSPPAEPADAPALAVTKVSLTASVCNGCTASVSIKTDAGAMCDIDVKYNSGSSTAAGLSPKTANSSGNVTWSWRVGSRTASGTYPIFIECSKGDRSGSLELQFKVV
jgi:hypothetical protein